MWRGSSKLSINFGGDPAHDQNSRFLTLVLRFYFYAHESRLGVKMPPGVYLEKRQICFFSTANLRELTRRLQSNFEDDPQPKVLISPKVRQISSKFQLQTQSFRPRQARKLYLHAISIMIDYRKWPPKPEILITLKLDEIASKFKRQIWGLLRCSTREVLASDCSINSTTSNSDMASKTGNHIQEKS